MQVAIRQYPPALMLKRSTSMSIYYTYLLKHIPTNTFYYGVRFAENCNPEEFWKSYFTSSKRKIPELREQYGDDSFEFEIRKTFECKHKAIDWESKVLRRMRVLQKPELWLNRTDNKAILNEVHPNTKGRPANKGSFQKGMSPWNKGKTGVQKASERQKNIARDRWLENNPNNDPIIMQKIKENHIGFSGKKHSQESIQKIKDSLKKKWQSKRGDL